MGPPTFPDPTQDHGGVWDGGGCCIHREFTSGLLRELLLESRELVTETLFRVLRGGGATAPLDHRLP